MLISGSMPPTALVSVKPCDSSLHQTARVLQLFFFLFPLFATAFERKSAAVIPVRAVANTRLYLHIQRNLGRVKSILESPCACSALARVSPHQISLVDPAEQSLPLKQHQFPKKTPAQQITAHWQNEGKLLCKKAGTLWALVCGGVVVQLQNTSKH